MKVGCKVAYRWETSTGKVKQVLFEICQLDALMWAVTEISKQGLMSSATT